MLSGQKLSVDQRKKTNVKLKSQVKIFKCKTDLEISICTNEFLKMYFLILSSLKRFRSNHVPEASSFFGFYIPLPHKREKAVDSKSGKLGYVALESKEELKKKKGCIRLRKSEGQKE